MPASYRTVKPSVGSGSLDRDAVRSVLAEIQVEAPSPAEGGGEDRELISRVRLAAAEGVRQASLRAIAAQIGMSPMGLRGFLQGSNTSPRTSRRLREWYVHQSAGRGESTSDEEEAFNALSVLVRDLPPDARARAIASILSGVENEYGRARQDPPAWLLAMRERFGIPADPGL